MRDLIAGHDNRETTSQARASQAELRILGFTRCGNRDWQATLLEEGEEFQQPGLHGDAGFSDSHLPQLRPPPSKPVERKRGAELCLQRRLAVPGRSTYELGIGRVVQFKPKVRRGTLPRSL